MTTNSIKKVNLDQIQRPKTLIVIHYKGKRVSIPIFQAIDNISQYLWHQLHKFQQTVLQKQKSKQQKIRNSYNIGDIMGFTVLEQDKNKLDIKMNILLSMCRLGKDYGRSRTDMKYLDITAYYKYMQIQPYYGYTSKQLIPEYQLFSILSQGAYFVNYLGRKVSDGRFYSIKVCRCDSKLAQNQYNCFKLIHHEQSHFQNKLQLELIPQIQQVRKAEGLYIFVYQYCPGGNLRNNLQQKITQIQCLHYMKQLVWGIHTLHTNFNLIHRAICFENLEVDFIGNLRIVNFAYCQPCYASSYLAQSNVPQSYQQRYQIPCVITPPQVRRSGRYNNLVDYYAIGTVLFQMFFGTKFQQYYQKGEKQGIEVAIQNFISQNIRDRQLFINQIIAELHEQKMKLYSSSSSSKKIQVIEHERLAFNKIYIGQSIAIEQKTMCGVKHQDIFKLLKPTPDDQLCYLHPVKKSRKKQKKKSKSKDSNSQDKSLNKSKTKLVGKPKPSNSINSNDKVQNKQKKNSSEKSINKSIDSRNNSAKSNKSINSKQGIKSKLGKQIVEGSAYPPKNLIPKSPKITSNMGGYVKSPPKNTLNQTSNFNDRHRYGGSPPKIVTVKSKNKL